MATKLPRFLCEFADGLCGKFAIFEYKMADEDGETYYTFRCKLHRGQRVPKEYEEVEL